MSSHCVFFIINWSVSSPVKLNPPTNVTVKNGSDSNLWLSWVQIFPNCVESEVRYRINNRKWGVCSLKEQKPFLSLIHYLFLHPCLFSTLSYHPQTPSPASTGTQSYCINLPIRNYRYELQVRSRVWSGCGQSDFWSEWSEPVVWGSNNGTGTTAKYLL